MTRVRLGANYARLWTATTVSNLGDGVTLAALPLLAASLTRSPTEVAAVTFALSLPWLFFALVGGALADRLDRRRTMAVVDGIRTLLLALLGALVLTDTISLILLAVVAFAIGTAETVFDNAAQSILPNVVARDALETANGRLYAGEVVTNQFVGPPLGAFLFAATASAPFLLDAGSFALAALLVLSLRGSFRPIRAAKPDGSARPSIRADIVEGLRWLAHHRLLRTLALSLGVLNLLSSAVFAVLVLYSLEVLDLSQEGYGILLVSGGIGALIGSLLGRRLSTALGPGTLVLTSAAMIGLATLVPAVWTQPVAVGISLALVGAFGVTWNIVTVSLRQAIIPDALLGRVNSAYRLLGWGSMPIGALLGGVLADAFGLRAPFVVGGVLPLLLTAVMYPIVNDRTIAAARAEAGA
jgi:predicted MFS family arabinose efflux permease